MSGPGDREKLGIQEVNSVSGGEVVPLCRLVRDCNLKKSSLDVF